MAKKQSGFAAEFAKQRAALGPGKTFTYQGKSYSTNRADDKPAAKPAGMASSPRPMAKPAAKPAGMASSPRPMAKPAEATAAAGGSRAPGANGKYSPTAEMRMRPTAPAAKPAGMASSPRPMPKPMAASSAGTTSSPRPKPRSAEALAAAGGPRAANPNRKYSPTEEMRLRNMKKGD